MTLVPLLLFLLACAAAYLGTLQAAFGALMRLSLRLAAESEGRHSELLGRYLDEPLALLVPTRVLLGLLTAVWAALLLLLVGHAGFRGAIVVLLGLAAFAVVCEQLVPLVIVRRDPERILHLLLPSFDVVARLLAPISNLIIELARPAEPEGDGTRRDAGAGSGGEPVGADTRPGSEWERPLLEDEGRRLLHAIVEFGNKLVREVMTPRPDIVAIQADATFAELRNLFIEQEYSRIPVYKGNLDNIVGFVFAKDLIQLDGVAQDDRPIPRLLRPAHFVPETKRVAELLKEFQRQQIQIAIVVDEYGGTAGLVTIEDLLEEIVGEIRDEYDVETEAVVDEGQGSFVFSGKVNIDEVAERLGVDIPREGFETLGGFLLSQLGRVPAVGETFQIGELAVEVLDAERRRVNRVRVRRQPVPTDAAP